MDFRRTQQTALENLLAIRRAYNTPIHEMAIPFEFLAADESTDKLRKLLGKSLRRFRRIARLRARHDVKPGRRRGYLHNGDLLQFRVRLAADNHQLMGAVSEGEKLRNELGCVISAVSLP